MMCALAVVTWVPHAWAQWLPGGMRLCQSGCTGDAPLVVADGTGGAFVAWRETSPINGSDVYLQRVTASGLIASGWPPGGVPVVALLASQQLLDLEPDGQGGALVVWYDFRNSAFGTAQDVYAQRILADGSIAPGWPLNGAPVSRGPGYQSFPLIQSDGAGGAYVAWWDELNYPDSDVYAQHLTAAGTVVDGWPENGLPVCTESGGQFPFGLVPDDEGGVVVVWGDHRNGVPATYAQRLLPDGTIAPGWAVNGLLVLDKFARGGAAGDGAGGFYAGAATIDFTNGDEFEYYVQRFTFAGARAPGWPAGGFQVCGAPRDRSGLFLKEDGVGGALLTWYDYRFEIFAARVLPEGTLAPGWAVDGTRVSDAAGAFLEYDPTIAPDGSGGAYVAWQREGGGERPSFVQHLTAAGAVAPGWPAYGVRFSPANSQFDTRIASDARGGAIVAWDERSTVRRGVWAQRFVLDGVVAAQVSLLSATAEPERVVLAWHVADAISFSADVERRSANSSWERLGPASIDGTGRIEYVDRDVTAGARYAYRLAYLEEGTERHTAEAWVDVPHALALALEGLRPNPAVRELAVSFALPSAAPATLELLDLAGRRLIARRVGSLGAGRHLLRLDQGQRLAPGVYWLRLTQSGRALVARGAVVR